MDLFSATQYFLFLVIVSTMVKPLGGYLERVFSRMTGKEYGTCFVLAGFAGTLLLYGVLRLQRFLPWFFPQYHTTPLSPDLALNTAISFSTTTPWQAYAGENTMSYFS